MKAVLKLCMNGIAGSTSLDLERMDLVDLDNYLMKNFRDVSELRGPLGYGDEIGIFLRAIPDREQYHNPNGSIRIFLENDDGTPVLETRAYGGRGYQRVQKQIRVLYNKNWEMFHKSDYESGNLDFRQLKEYLIEYYKDSPDLFRELLQACYKELANTMWQGDYGLNSFMSYEDFVDVQKEMLGDSRSLFDRRPIHISHKKKYDRLVESFIYGLKIKNMGDAYLPIREAAGTIIDQKNLKPRKLLKLPPPILPETLDDLVRQKFYKSERKDYPNPDVESIIEDYWSMQPEGQQEQRYDSLSRIKK